MCGLSRRPDYVWGVCPPTRLLCWPFRAPTMFVRLSNSLEVVTLLLATKATNSTIAHLELFLPNLHSGSLIRFIRQEGCDTRLINLSA